MANKEDLRVKKTKKALQTAFLNLLSKKPFEEITVNELCEEAGVRRATFYKHYADKFSFLTAFTHDLRDRFDKVIWHRENFDSDAEYFVAYAKRLVGYISEHEAAVNNIIKSNLFNAMFSTIIEQNFKDTKERLEKSVAAGMRLHASVETISAMCTGGIASAIYHWVLEGRKKSPDALAEEIGALVQSLIGHK